MTTKQNKPGELMGAVHRALRERHYSVLTERAYTSWIRRLILSCGRRHPASLEPKDLKAFFDGLATGANVSESTHNQALCAVVFLYRRVLNQPMPWLDSLERPRRHKHLPVVLSRNEVQRILDAMEGTPKLMASLLSVCSRELMVV
jgi:site-specific recombinase XerD